MNNLWSKAKSHDNWQYNGESIKRFRFKPKPGISYNVTNVYKRANAIRKRLEQHHPGQYEISVAVRDVNVGGWRSGKFSSTSNSAIYIWTPDEYSKEYTGTPSGNLPDLKVDMMDIFVRKSG